MKEGNLFYHKFKEFPLHIMPLMVDEDFVSGLKVASCRRYPPCGCAVGERCRNSVCGVSNTPSAHSLRIFNVPTKFLSTHLMNDSAYSGN